MKVIVIGGGPGGYVAALKAAILGAETILVEKNNVGGTCLNRGCIPTKSFLQSTTALDGIMNAKTFGVTCDSASVNYAAVLERKNALVKQLVSGVEFLLKKRGVKLIKGVGRIVGEKTIEVTDSTGKEQTISADAIILATGSKPVVHDMFHYDGNKVITSDEALNLEELPKSMVIIGGGVIGCEFGQFFKKLGVDVTIVELADRILPMEDSDASLILTKSLKKEGVNILTGIKVESVVVNENDVDVMLSNGETLTSEKMLVSVGRKSMVEGLGIEELGIELKNGKVVVNEKMQTSLEGCYAIGDIVASPALAHVASREAIVAVENIMGKEGIMTYHAVPRCVYTHPEIACVGMTEDRAKEKGVSYKIGKFNLAGLGKAMVMNETNGFIKIIANEEGIILGAAMAGPHTTDMVSELAIAVELGLSAHQLGGVIHPHPTIAEAIIEGVHNIDGEAVHSF